MTTDERMILLTFRRFEAGTNQMLFLNHTGVESKLQTSRFKTAVETLIANGLVVKERPHHAYSLTQAGYEASRAVTA